MMFSDVLEEQVDALLDRIDGGGPGCAVAITVGGALAYARGVGLANLEYGVPITPDTSFHSASVSKQFTAGAIALLATRGLLSLDEEIQTYLPRVHRFGSAITLSHLVHHTSGLRDQWTLLAAAGWRPADLVTTHDVLALTYAQRTLNFQPGTQFNYSNTGYTLLAEVVREVSGLTLRDFCEHEFFGPLGMTRTHFHDDVAELVPGRAQSYVARGDRHRHAPLNYSVSGATSLHTTVRDLARWQVHLRGDERTGSPGWLDLIHRVGVSGEDPTVGYAFGLLIDEHRGSRRVGHSGSDAAFTAQTVRLPELDVSVAVMANGSSLSAWDTAREIIDLYLDQRGGDRQPSDDVPVAANDLEALVGLYVDPTTGAPLDVVRDEDHLAVRDGDHCAALARVSGHSYRFAPSSRLTFSAESPARQVVVTPLLGTPEVFERVPWPTTGTRDLSDLAGLFWSEELDACVRVEVRDAELFLLPRKISPIPLQPTCPDAFSGQWSDSDQSQAFAVLFDRSDSGKVTSLQVSFPWSRHIKWLKVAQASRRPPTRGRW